MVIVKLRPTMCLILSVNPLATAFFDEMRQIVAKLDQFIYFWFSVDCFLRSIHYLGGVRTPYFLWTLASSTIFNWFCFNKNQCHIIGLAQQNLNVY